MRPPRILATSALVLAALVVSTRLAGGPTVVYGENDLYVLDATPAPSGPAEPAPHAFFEAYRADIARQAPLETALDLISPPAWGKTVSAATRGAIQFHPSFPGGLACLVTLDGLLPGHAYILTLNGNPALAGNDLLLTPVTPGSRERYYDFIIVKTDAQGHFARNFGIYLKPGKYDARCYVKDTGDFKIVLYHDYFPFEVR
jgi:hypothetical protein